MDAMIEIYARLTILITLTTLDEQTGVIPRLLVLHCSSRYWIANGCRMSL